MTGDVSLRDKVGRESLEIGVRGKKVRLEVRVE